MESMANNNDLASNGFVQPEEICRSLKINQETKTPYSDATQVRKYFHTTDILL